MLALLCSADCDFCARRKTPPLPARGRRLPPISRSSRARSIVVHEGVADRADAPAMLVDGDVVRTRNGRAEIVFADGTLLHLDHDTELEAAVADARAPASSGRVVAAHVRRGDAAVRRSTRRPPSSGSTPRGEYGVTSSGRLGRLEVTVARGVRGGRRTPDRDSWCAAARWRRFSAPAAARCSSTFNSARWDAFARWANDRTNGFAASHVGATTAVRAACRTATSFDQLRALGLRRAVRQRVVPRRSPSHWRPYYDGVVAAHALRLDVGTGTIRWAWPTHHLRPLGIHRRVVVLDSGERVGPGVGELGVRAGLRELVRRSGGTDGRDRLLAAAIIRRTGRTTIRGARWTVMPRDSLRRPRGRCARTRSIRRRLAGRNAARDGRCRRGAARHASSTPCRDARRDATRASAPPRRRATTRGAARQRRRSAPRRRTHTRIAARPAPTAADGRRHRRRTAARRDRACGAATNAAEPQRAAIRRDARRRVADAATATPPTYAPAYTPPPSAAARRSARTNRGAATACETREYAQPRDGTDRGARAPRSVSAATAAPRTRRRRGAAAPQRGASGGVVAARQQRREAAAERAAPPRQRRLAAGAVDRRHAAVDGSGERTTEH